MQIKELHQTPSHCCGNIDNLEPIMVRLEVGVGITHFCKECGRIGLSEMTTFDEESAKSNVNQLEYIDMVVKNKIKYITYPTAPKQYKFGTLDVLSKKIIIPFKNEISESSSESSKTKKRTNKKSTSNN